MEDSITVKVAPSTTRAFWSSHVEFVLCCIGFSIGLGNIWRFPYVAYVNGGGAFLLSYIAMLVLIGFPLYFMELSLGQLTGLGPPKCYKICPVIKGVGWAQIFTQIFISIYYNCIMAFALFYMFACLQPKLPWMFCSNAYNTANCSDISHRSTDSTYASLNATNVTSSATSYFTSPSDEYWNNYVIQSHLSTGINDLGGLNYRLLGANLISWLFIFLCLSRGISSIGKIAYVTSTLPFVLLIILLGRGLTLSGAINGIRYFLYPEWTKLMNIKVWNAAISQAFFSLGIGWGCLISFSSYNHFNYNCYNDSLLISVLDTVVSLAAGLINFSVLGFMAQKLKKNISQVTSKSIGLAFIVYPEALGTLPLPQLWSFLFFTMLYNLGLNTQFAILESIVTGLHDQFPNLLPQSRQFLTRFLVCLFFFVMSLPCVTYGGLYVISLLDYIFSLYGLLLLTTCEVIGIMWVYGCERFYANVAKMIGPDKIHVPCLWKFSWRFLSPCALIFISIFSAKNYRRILAEILHYPLWSLLSCFCIFVLIYMQVPVFALKEILSRKEASFVGKAKASLIPSSKFELHLNERSDFKVKE